MRVTFWPKLSATLRGPQWAPYGHPYGYPIGHPFIGSTSLIYCPFGAGMWHPPAHICSVPLRDILFLRAPSGPLMGTHRAPMWVPLRGPHFSKLNYLLFTCKRPPRSIWGGVGGGAHMRHSRMFTPRSHIFWPLFPVGFSFTSCGHITSFLFLKEPTGLRYGPHEVWAHMGWVGHPPH